MDRPPLGIALHGSRRGRQLVPAGEQADTKKVWFSTEEFPKRYRISHKTRAAGTAELVARGLLKTERETLAERWKPSVFDPVRKRTIYRLTDESDARTAVTQLSKYFQLSDDPITASSPDPGQVQ